MSFKINNKLFFIDSFQFVTSSLDSLIKNFDENLFEDFSKEIDSNVFDLVKQKGFYPYDYMTGFQKF